MRVGVGSSLHLSSASVSSGSEVFLEKEDGAPFALRAIIALLCSLSQGLSPVGAFLKLFHKPASF